MPEVSIRDLRNHGGEVVDRVAHGERVVVTRSGRAVAELRPVPSGNLTAAVLIARRRHLPKVDPERWRQDIDLAIDSSL